MAKYDPASTASGSELAPRAGDASASIHVPTSATFYEAAIEGLTRLNEEMLSLSHFPRLYESGARYRKEKEDTWRHADDVLCSGWGDCEDLAAWRAAELRVSGEDPDARVYVYRSGPQRFHAVVARGNGRIEDPSIILGMRVSAARQRQLPKWEGDAEMDDTQPRAFGACSRSQTGEDMLSQGTVGEMRSIFDEPPQQGVGWFGGNALKSLARSVSRTARRAAPRMPGIPRVFSSSPAFQSARSMMLGVESDGGSGEDGVAGELNIPVEAQDQMLLGAADDGYYDEAGTEDPYASDPYASDPYASDPYASDPYAQEAPPEEVYQEPPPPSAPSGPNPIERAMMSAGSGIKSGASAVWNTAKDALAPIKYGVQIATAPIKVVQQGSKLVKKYTDMPLNAIKKVFSFLGEVEDVEAAFAHGINRVTPSMLGYVDDPDYEEGDSDIWTEQPDEDFNEEIFDVAPESQKPRFRTEQIGPGVWQGQVILPSKEPGKAFTMTTSPAPDEQSAGERMYNLAQHAANTPAMMALTNPLAFAVLMTMKGTSKIPFGSAFKAIGSGISTAARAVGRGAESVARTATSW